MSGRVPEQRISDLETHPTRYVCLIVAADYLEIDIRTLDKWIDEGRLATTPFGRRRKIAISEVRRFERARMPHAS